MMKAIQVSKATLLVATLSVFFLGHEAATASSMPEGSPAQFSLGLLHTCARLHDGTVRCWGYNRTGAVGDGTLSDMRLLPTKVHSLSGVAQVASGNYHSCALLADGTVKCWGSNNFGQLGDAPNGVPDWRTIPVVVANLSSVIQIAAGGEHTCALLSTGTVKCWGQNTHGQLGDGTNDDARYAPAAVVGLSDVVEISAGAYHTCARLRDGSIKCWGRNIEGQAGDGTSGSGNFRRTPVTVIGIHNATEIKAGGLHTCARLSNGTVHCWGYNRDGQVGDGTSGNHRPTPQPVVGIGNVLGIAAGNHHTCARLSDKTVRCWGENSFGQLGNGNSAPESSLSSPVSVLRLSGVIAIEAGGYHTCALLEDGTMRCWGANQFGQLGEGTHGYEHDRPVEVVGLTGAKEIGAGWRYTCARLGSGGVMCWGDNYYGQIGDGAGGRGVVRSMPTTVFGLDNTLEIALGMYHACARLSDGTVRCWGANDKGQLGNGVSGGSHAYPVPVAALSGAVEVVAGSRHTCARMSDGTVKCWGDNLYGQLGNGTSGVNNFRTTPESVVGLSNAVAIAAGENHTCALLSNGTVRCWGDNSYGQLGEGTSGSGNNRSTPTVVSGLSGVVEIAAGGMHTCARLADGTVKCWGRNYEGQIGDGTMGVGIIRSLPTTTLGLSNARSIAAGYAHTCALLNDGTVKCWGYNFFGQLGNGTRGLGSDRALPIAVDGLSDAVEVTAGGMHTCARLVDDRVKCWGNSFFGQLGDGMRLVRNSADREVVLPFKHFPSASLAHRGLTVTLQWRGGLTSTHHYRYCITQLASCVPALQLSAQVVTLALSGGGVYTWQVRACVDGNCSQFVDADSRAFALGVFSVFSKSSPINRAIDVSTEDLALVWESSSGAEWYEVCFDDLINNSCNQMWRSIGAVQSVTISSLRPDTTYEWQVRACNAVGCVEADDGQWWLFKTAPAPGLFSKLAPGEGEIGVQTGAVELQWQESSNALWYEICVGSSAGTCELTGGGWLSLSGQLSWTVPAPLQPSTVYWWQVRAHGLHGRTVSADDDQWFFFVTSPISTTHAFSKRFPINGVGGITSAARLEWSSLEHASGYEVCVGTRIGICDVVSWHSVSGDTHFAVNDLRMGSTYWWQVRATIGSDRVFADDGAWWFFTTANPQIQPLRLRKQLPRSGAANVPTTSVTLRWEAVMDVDRYEVCVGTMPGNCSKTGGWVQTSVPAYVVQGLRAGALYWWQVRAVRGDNVIAADEGIPWMFQTVASTSSSVEKLSPANRATEVEPSAELVWRSNTGAIAGYRICIGTLRGLCDVHNAVVTNAQSRLLGDLQAGKLYWWQVLAFGAGGQQPADEGNWWFFVTRNSSAAALQKTAPQNGEVVSLDELPLSWSDGSGTDFYHLCVGTSIGVCDVVNVQTSTNRYVMELRGLRGGAYWWQVRGLRRTDYSSTQADNGEWWRFIVPHRLFVPVALRPAAD